MAYADDPDLFEKRLNAKLQPSAIRSTLAFAGLYQIAHEMLKKSVLEQVHDFYLRGFDESGMTYDEVGYARDVLARAPSKFRASLLWLVDSEAITISQADRLDDIYAHRHQLTHELIKYVIDPDVDLDVDLFTDALSILKSVSRFWTKIEIDIGSFEHLGAVEPDEAVPLSLVVLQQCIDAVIEGLGVETPTSTR